MLPALIYSPCAGGGHLSEVGAFREDAAACRVSGLRAVPDSQRLGEYLGRMTRRALTGIGAGLARDYRGTQLEGQWWFRRVWEASGLLGV